MGSFYTSIHVHTKKHEAVTQALEHCNALPAFVSKPGNSDWTSIYPKSTESQDQDLIQRLVQKLSKQLHTGVFGMLVHDSDMFWYVLCENGLVTDVYDSDPGYFSGREQAPRGGNLEALLHYCVEGTTIHELDDLLLKREPVPAQDTAALMTALQSGDLSKISLNQASDFRGDHLAREFGIKLGLPAGRASVGFSYIRQGTRPENTTLIREQQDAEETAEGAPNLLTEEQYNKWRKSRDQDFRRAMLAQQMAAQAELAKQSEVGKESKWFGSVVNDGGYAVGLKLMLRAQELDEGMFAEPLEAVVSKFPNSENEDDLPEPDDESYWPHAALFQKSTTASNLWECDFPDFEITKKLLVRLPIIAKKPGDAVLQLQVLPLHEEGTSTATFVIELKVSNPQPKLRLVQAESADHDVGPYRITLPGKYDVKTQHMHPLAAAIGAKAEMRAFDQREIVMSIGIMDGTKIDRHKTEVNNLLQSTRLKAKLRNFTSTPVQPLSVNGLLVTYSRWRCDEMRAFGLIASGVDNDNIFYIVAQSRRVEQVDEFEQALQSFRRIE